MKKKTIVCGLLSLGALFFLIPEPEFSVSQVMRATSEKWTSGSFNPSDEKVFAQPFTYMGCGAQAYVFFSEDGTSVLKLFKKKRFEVPLWIRLLPPVPYKAKKIASKRGNLIRDFTSYQIAYDELREETGLICVHLDKTPLQSTITLIDGDKKQHTIQLGDYAFILQKKGELVYPVLEQYVKQGNIAAAKESLTALVHLLKERCDKGVADRDPTFSKNYAFLSSLGHQKAVEIDIGRFSHDPVKAPNIPRDFKEWLEGLSPELHSHFEVAYQEAFGSFNKQPSSHE
jgi:hypothetical protein